MKLFKITYFKYLIILLLSLKTVSAIAENTKLLFDEVTSLCQYEADEDNNSEEKQETENNEETQEFKDIVFFDFISNSILRTSQTVFCSMTPIYQTRYIEFATPPPRVF